MSKGSSGRATLDAAVASLATSPVVQAQAKAAEPDVAPPETARRVRVRYEADKKSASRFFLEVEGERKLLKGHVVEIAPALVERLKATGEWIDVLLWSGAGKVRIEAV
jgi:hypothetical protein